MIICTRRQLGESRNGQRKSPAAARACKRGALFGVATRAATGRTSIQRGGARRLTGAISDGLSSGAEVASERHRPTQLWRGGV